MILKQILKFTPNAKREKSLTLLEIGSAFGFFMDEAQKYFTVTGVEINQEAASFARSRGHKVYAGDFLNIDFGDQKYDLIVSIATLEHLPNPLDYLEKIALLMKPGGIFYCTTVDIGCAIAKLSGSRWRMIHPPTHVNYFSKETLCRLVNRFHINVLECGSIWQFRSLDVLFYSLNNKKNKLNLFYRIIKSLKILEIPIPFNFGDVMMLIGEKEEI